MVTPGSALRSNPRAAHIELAPMALWSRRTSTPCPATKRSLIFLLDVEAYTLEGAFRALFVMHLPGKVPSDIHRRPLATRPLRTTRSR